MGRLKTTGFFWTNRWSLKGTLFIPGGFCCPTFSPYSIRMADQISSSAVSVEASPGSPPLIATSRVGRSTIRGTASRAKTKFKSAAVDKEAKRKQRALRNRTLGFLERRFLSLLHH